MKSITQFVFCLFIGITFLILLGCDAVENNDFRNIQVLTNANYYNIDSSQTIILLVANNSQNPIYYVCSGDIYLEEIKDGLVIKEWKVYGFEECLAIRSIQPKEMKEYIFTYKSNPSVFKLQDAKYAQSVRYRFRADFYYDMSLETELKPGDKYSNEIFLLK